ncbi:MAG TPA: NAD(P)/FAD-dependent oxidoreductase [Gaiellaceae bacterium]|nr:NAD(P)/FAD-dependent oxidoreductase [Gaiellaceae bacterium]
MPEHADVVVLGMGAGGEDLGLRLTEAGLDVVGIEAELLGGECPYWACIPSKMMIRAANLLQEARRANGAAGRVEVTPDWAPVAARIRQEATGDWDDSSAVARFEGRGGRFVRGRGTLTGPRTVTVDTQSFTATRGIVIATGSKPHIPPIPGLAEIDYWTTRDAIKADPLPRSLIVLGGGGAGCELGQVFSRFGVDVTIVEARDRLLPLEEAEASEVVASAFEAEGIAVRTRAQVERVEATDGSIQVTLGDRSTLTADRLLVATGRTVDLTNLGLEAAGLDGSGSLIEVDDHLRAASGIWAVGDVTGKPMFTHTALYQASIVAGDILGESPSPPDYSAFPRVTFTDPEVAAVGMSESEAREAGLDVGVTVKNVPATFRGWLHGPGNEGVVKLVVDRAAGVLVGATSVGPNGGEILGLLSAAVHARIPTESLRRMIYAYPTFHGGLGEALGAYARGIGKVLDPAYASGDVLDW